MAEVRTIGSYQLLERIGRGGFGDVYRAQRWGTDEVVALKTLRGDFAEDHEIVTRFLQERSALVSLNHPGLVRVRDLIVEGGVAAIVMDLLNGGDLKGYLAERGRLEPTDALEKMIGILDALAFVHASGIFHRDVKPSNVLLDDKGNPHLADFGIAKVLERPGVTQAYAVLGTPTYAAPEMPEETRVTPACDVYSAGIMCFELLTGAPPFSASNPLALMRAHAETTVGYPPEVSEDLREFFEQVLAKLPDDRPSAAAAADMLRALLAGGADRLIVGAVAGSVLVIPDGDQESDRTVIVKPEEGTDHTVITRGGPATEDDATALGPKVSSRADTAGGGLDVTTNDRTILQGAGVATGAGIAAAQASSAILDSGDSTHDSSLSEADGASARRKRTLLMVGAAGVVVAGGVAAAVTLLGGSTTSPAVSAQPVRALPSAPDRRPAAPQAGDVTTTTQAVATTPIPGVTPSAQSTAPQGGGGTAAPPPTTAAPPPPNQPTMSVTPSLDSSTCTVGVASSNGATLSVTWHTTLVSNGTTASYDWSGGGQSGSGSVTPSDPGCPQWTPT